MKNTRSYVGNRETFSLSFRDDKILELLNPLDFVKIQSEFEGGIIDMIDLEDKGNLYNDVLRLMQICGSS